MNDFKIKVLSQYGIRELQGPEQNNPEILKYFDCTGETWVKTDETAWCSALCNWAAFETGYEYSGKLNARSWLDCGIPVHSIEESDIVIFWRKAVDDWRGHVGVPIRNDGSMIWTLGGNQSNMVCCKQYPQERILGFRKLTKR